MPSASTKPDKPVAPTTAAAVPEDPLKQAISVIEKKVRNIEKRKGKLDVYRDKKAKGETLNADQEEAMTQFVVVEQNLTMCRELHKQFQQLEIDMEKAARKQAKRQGFEQAAADLARCREMLMLQATLDGLCDEVRPDLLAGSRGAPQLSEEQLTQLDELYKLVQPSREAERAFDEEIAAAAEHLQLYLSASEKEVVGTTYKALKEIVESIHSSGYLDQPPAEAAAEEEEPAVEVEAVEEPEAESPEPAISQDDDSEVATQDSDDGMVPHEPTTITFVQDPEPITQQQQYLPEPTPVSLPHAPMYHASAVPMPQEAYVVPVPQQAPVPVDPYNYAAMAAAAAARRPDVSEIVGQQGFSFLQDSELEPPAPARADPAVVEALPAGLHFVQPPEYPPEHVYQPEPVLPEPSQLPVITAPFPPAAYPPPFPDIPAEAPSGSPPPAIPMPVEQDASATQGMNPNAAMFHPVQHEQQPTYEDQQQCEEYGEQQQAHDFSAQQGYGFEYRGGPRGGPPARGGRGGGYRGGDRGGAPRGGGYQQRGGQYNGQRGGGPRGGGQQEGYTNGYGGGQRGGAPRGGQRGGAAPRGGNGAPRGGPPSSSGAAPRGPRPGGYAAAARGPASQQ